MVGKLRALAAQHEDRLMVRVPDEAAAHPAVIMGRTMKEYALLTGAVDLSAKAFADWIERGYRYTRGLPPRAAKAKPAKPAEARQGRRAEGEDWRHGDEGRRDRQGCEETAPGLSSPARAALDRVRLTEASRTRRQLAEGAARSASACPGQAAPPCDGGGLFEGSSSKNFQVLAPSNSRTLIDAMS